MGRYGPRGGSLQGKRNPASAKRKRAEVHELNAAGEEMQHHHRLGVDQCLNAVTVVHES